MRKLLVATLAAVFGASVIMMGQPQLEIEHVELWFVELSSPPTSEGTSPSALAREETNFRSAASGAGIRYTEGRRFRSLWNGLTVRASATDVPKLRSLPGVQAVYPVVLVHPAQEIEGPPGNVADLVTALQMTGADVAQQELGLTGRGVRVAVMDSGLDYDHPDLGGCFGPGCRVARGFDFVGDAFNPNPAAAGFNPIPVPDPFPDDCDGHGTHVSGIIGANGDITGVAPDVTFHAYRVFGCEGPTTADIMLAAMEMTLDNGADVLNMSIGSAFQWPQYPTAQAANRLVRRGVTVVAALGNEGSFGLYSAAAPGVGREVIGVASFDNTHVNLRTFTVSPDDFPIGYQNASGAPLAPLAGTFPMVATGDPESMSDACTPLPAGSLSGRVALIRRGTCSFYQKAFNAQSAGAAGVVLYNNVAGRVAATVAGTPPITIPVVTITAADGALIHSRLPGASLTWTGNTVSDPLPTGGLISSFSSWGLAADLSFKPDLGAPGGMVRSTLPIEQGSFGSVSGTSMASPHVAGAVALLLEAVPRADPHEVMARLQNNAQPHLWAGNPALGFLDNVHRQGAGMVTIPNAAEADALVNPSNLALGELESSAPVWRLLRVSSTELRRDWFHRKRGHRHDDGNAVTFTLGHQPALSTGANTFSPTFFAGFATVEFSSPIVSIGDRRGSRDAWIVVSITRPAIPVAKLFGGYITLTPDDGGPVLRVPYAGYNGDYQEIQALTPTAAGFPWLAKLVPPSLVNQPNGAVFTLEGTDLPFIILHLDHQVRRLKMKVIDVATGQSFNFATDEDHLGRNSTPTAAFVFVWDGTTTRRPNGRARPVPNGTYRIEMSVLKALGDPRNPAHTEEWTSPPITIARP